jgi:hypothetical protein
VFRRSARQRSSWKARAVWATLALLAARPTPARAGDADEDTSAIDGTAPPEKRSAWPLGDDLKRVIDFRGRMFVLADRQAETIDAGQGPIDTRVFSLSIPSARVDVKVRVRDRVQLVLEVDFADKSPLKDAFVQAKSRHWLLRVGRFKMPLSAFTLESPWTLPRAHRGALEDLLADHLLLFGRRLGLMARLAGGGWWDPALTVGLFQSVLWGGEVAGDPVAMSSPRDLTSVVRLSVNPGDSEVGLVGQRRVTVIGESRSFGTVGLDATSAVARGAYALRLWGEGFVGKSWYRQDAPFSDPALIAATAPVTFLEVRAMAAFRLGGQERGDGYAEVFFYGGVLDPDASVTQDQFFELSGGLNVGHWQKTRVTLEIEHGRTSRNFPVSYFRDFGLPTVTRHTAAMLQVGAAF